VNTSIHKEEIVKATLAANTSPVGQSTGKRALNVTVWVLQLLLAFMFFGGGASKLSGAPEMVEMFTAIGVGQWLRYVVGTLEIAGAIGLLIPRLSRWAALGLVTLMVGATLTNLFILNVNSVVSIVFLLVSALIAAWRWSQSR
jgi:putative oxidoreductase